MQRLTSTRAVIAVAMGGLALAFAVLPGCSGGDASPDAAAGAVPAEKVTVAGDSISVGIGVALRDELDNEYDVKVIGDGGTGLARPDNFDWPARLAELARDFPPEVLVLSLGSNDAQDLTDGSGNVVALRRDEAEWEAEYRRRLEASVDPFAATGTQVVWVGHVRTEDEDVADTNRQIHRIATEVAAERDWMVSEDLAELTGSGDDETSDCLISDGLHLELECYQLAAEGITARPPF